MENNGWKFDKTINIPILLALVSALVTGTLAYANVNSKAEKALDTSQRVERNQTEQTQAAAQQMTALRIEMRADNKAMADKIDQVIFRLGDTPRNLKEWTK